MTKRQIVSTDRGPRTGLPYSQAVRYGDLVFVAGQVGLDPATGQIVPGGVLGQTRQVLRNIQAILEAAGTSLDHTLEALCFLRDIGDFAAFNEVYRTFFPIDPPARTTVQAPLARDELLVEIRVVAAMRPGPVSRARTGGSGRPGRPASRAQSPRRSRRRTRPRAARRTGR
jgi:2-iminobutanoate/2-iminopropanoate deaminase